MEFNTAIVILLKFLQYAVTAYLVAERKKPCMVVLYTVVTLVFFVAFPSRVFERLAFSFIILFISFDIVNCAPTPPQRNQPSPLSSLSMMDKALLL